MRDLKRGCVVLLLTLASACSGSNASPTAASNPSAAPSTAIPPPTTTFHVTGVVSEDDGNPVTGAAVTILNPPVSGVSGMTDGSGVYSLDFSVKGNIGAGSIVGWLKVDSAGHDSSYNYLMPASGSQNILQNAHVYRIERITVGESTLLTTVRGDTACGDSDEFVCRTLHIVAPTDGVMTIEAVPTPSAAEAGLEIARGSAYQCCSLTASVSVTAGTEVIANIGMWWTSTASQSFVVNTSPVRP
jgi:hypothetical protein